MNTETRKTYSAKTIIDHWAEHEDEFPSIRSHSIGWGEPFCFGCGWLPPVTGQRIWDKAQRWLDKAHLEDWAYKHNDEVENIVYLCHLCHTDMPSFEERQSAMEWVENRPQAEWLWQVWTDRVFQDRSSPPNRNTTMFRARMKFLEAMNSARIQVAEDDSQSNPVRSE